MSEPEINRLLVRELAGKYQVDERTLIKVLQGKPIRTLGAADRAKTAADEYRKRTQGGPK